MIVAPWHCSHRERAHSNKAEGEVHANKLEQKPATGVYYSCDLRTASSLLLPLEVWAQGPCGQAVPFDVLPLAPAGWSFFSLNHVGCIVIRFMVNSQMRILG